MRMTMLQGVPYFEQERDFTCGPAVLRMILAYFGVSVSEEHLSQEVHTGHAYGTHHRWLIEAPCHHGLHTYVHDHATLAQIERFLEDGCPVVVHFLNSDDNDGHYSVIVGIDDTDVIFNDPWPPLGKEFRLPRGEFERRWHDEKNRFPSWAMAVSDKPFAQGVQHHPTRDTMD